MFDKKYNYVIKLYLTLKIGIGLSANVTMTGVRLVLSTIFNIKNMHIAKDSIKVISHDIRSNIVRFTSAMKWIPWIVVISQYSLIVSLTMEKFGIFAIIFFHARKRGKIIIHWLAKTIECYDTIFSFLQYNWIHFLASYTCNFQEFVEFYSIKMDTYLKFTVISNNENYLIFY